MSVKATNAVWEQSETTGVARLILLAIADHADPRGRAWPGVGRLAKMCGLSDPRSVQRHVAKLIEMGELRREVGAGPRGTNLYHITLDLSENSKKTPPAIQPPRQNGHPDNSRPTPPDVEPPTPGNPAPTPPDAQPPEPSLNPHEPEREPPREDASSLSPFSREGVFAFAEVYPFAPDAITADEAKAIRESGNILNEMTEEDFLALRVWTVEVNDEQRGRSLWPRSRTEFLRNVGEALPQVREWWEHSGRNWWDRKLKREAEKAEPESQGPDTPHEEFYDFALEAGKDMNQVAEAWKDQRWKKEYNAWLLKKVNDDEPFIKIIN